MDRRQYSGRSDMLAEQPHASSAQAVGAVSGHLSRTSNNWARGDPDMGLALSRSAGMRALPHGRAGLATNHTAALLTAEQRLAVTDAAGQRLFSASDPWRALRVWRGRVASTIPMKRSVTSASEHGFWRYGLLTDGRQRTVRAVTSATLWTLSARAFADLTIRYRAALRAEPGTSALSLEGRRSPSKDCASYGLSTAGRTLM